LDAWANPEKRKNTSNKLCENCGIETHDPIVQIPSVIPMYSKMAFNAMLQSMLRTEHEQRIETFRSFSTMEMREAGATTTDSGSGLRIHSTHYGQWRLDDLLIYLNGLRDTWRHPQSSRVRKTSDRKTICFIFGVTEDNIDFLSSVLLQILPKLAIQLEAGCEWVIYHRKMDEIPRDTSAGTQGRVNKRKNLFRCTSISGQFPATEPEPGSFVIGGKILTCKKRILENV
jgi:hypothetical protein